MQVISPFTAGNANDTVARVVLDQVSRQLGQPFVIENKPGGGGTIGPAMVAKAEGDGYTILLHSSSLSSQVVLHRTLPYDPIRDFAPVVVFGIQPNVLVAAASDRKSTRLNSSHLGISYAVFCLKKKKIYDT